MDRLPLCLSFISIARTIHYTVLQLFKLGNMSGLAYVVYVRPLYPNFWVDAVLCVSIIFKVPLHHLSETSPLFKLHLTWSRSIGSDAAILASCQPYLARIRDVTEAVALLYGAR